MCGSMRQRDRGVKEERDRGREKRKTERKTERREREKEGEKMETAKERSVREGRGERQQESQIERGMDQNRGTEWRKNDGDRTETYTSRAL